jgi:small subunit ribosomal protein S20
MPRSRSSRKSHRKSEKRKKVNRENMSRLRTELKKARALLEEGKVEEGKAQVVKAVQNLDKAAKRHIIHPNKAARDKSRLARRLAKASAKK